MDQYHADPDRFSDKLVWLVLIAENVISVILKLILSSKEFTLALKNPEQMSPQVLDGSISGPKKGYMFTKIFFQKTVTFIKHILAHLQQLFFFYLVNSKVDFGIWLVLLLSL